MHQNYSQPKETTRASDFQPEDGDGLSHSFLLFTPTSAPASDFHLCTTISKRSYCFFIFRVFFLCINSFLITPTYPQEAFLNVNHFV